MTPEYGETKESVFFTSRLDLVNDQIPASALFFPSAKTSLRRATGSASFCGDEEVRTALALVSPHPAIAPHAIPRRIESRATKRIDIKVPRHESITLTDESALL